MECPNCRAENLEGKKFCGDCGVELPQPLPPEPVEPSQAVYAQPRQSWMRSNWKGLVSLVIVMIVALSVVGLVYTQPWSKIAVWVTNDQHGDVGLNVYIDGELMASISVASGGPILLGKWSVTVGSHALAIDAGSWSYTPSVWVPEYWDWWSLSYQGGYYTADYWTYTGPDGTPDMRYTYEVGPIYTKNVYVTV